MNQPPIRSGNVLIDARFDLSVDILLWPADLFGVSYNTVNIWVFCVIWPIFTIALMAIVIRQHLKLRKLKQRLNKEEKSEQTD